ncbi:MAG: Sensor kinase CusS [Actinobacteria bacterium ADurb.Bin444]|nr:MAG: Sensor kinase CusS [Actinobacteria bacterium ADurb.Bin444]
MDTLLILSRYDSRQYRPHLQPVDVTHLVADEIQLLADAGMAEPNRILLEGDATVSAVTDAVMLRQAVANLLHNAVQYGGDEPVAVTVRAEGGRVQIIVSNGGAPIPMDERARIFDRFYRGRASARVGGFGLGLPLVKEICAALGGEVALAPDPTRTVFVIDLPAGAPTVAAPDVV